MAKNKIIILITLFIFNITSSNAYEILELIEILNKKNQTESIFYYDNKINRLNIKNSYSSFYPSVSYSNKTSDTETKTSSTSSVSSNTHSLSVDLNLYNGGYTNQNIIETKNKNYANSSLDEYKKSLLIKELILGSLVSNSIIQFFCFPLPDCIAFFAGM